MRQNDYIFDIKNKKIGIGRAVCSKNPNMIMSEDDYISNGFVFGLDNPSI